MLPSKQQHTVEFKLPRPLRTCGIGVHPLLIPSPQHTCHFPKVTGPRANNAPLHHVTAVNSLPQCCRRTAHHLDTIFVTAGLMHLY